MHHHKRVIGKYYHTQVGTYINDLVLSFAALLMVPRV